MNPSPSDRHISRPLTNLSIAYTQDAEDFVARRVFPVVPVMKQYDRFYVFDQADFNRVQMKKRAPATESAEGVYRLSDSNYAADVFGLHKDIDDRERSNSDEVFSLDADATEFLAQQALIQEETDFAAKYMVGSVWGTTITGVASTPSSTQVLHWSDGASTPLEDIAAGQDAIQVNTGRRANKLVLGQQVWTQLKNHPDIVDRIKYGAGPAAPARVQRQAVAQLLEIDEILVMGGVQNTAAEGQAVAHSFIGGKNALLVHAAMRPARMTPSAGYTFAWRGYIGGTSPVAIKRFRMEHLNSDRVEIESAYVQQITGAPLGYFFGSVVA